MNKMWALLGFLVWADVWLAFDVRKLRRELSELHSARELLRKKNDLAFHKGKLEGLDEVILAIRKWDAAHPANIQRSEP